MYETESDEDEPKSKRARFGNFLGKIKDKVKDSFNKIFSRN